MRSTCLLASLAFLFVVGCSDAGSATDASAGDTDAVDTSYEANANAGGPACGYAENGSDSLYCRPGDNCVAQCNRGVAGSCADSAANRCEAPTGKQYQSFAAGDGTNCGFGPGGDRYSCKRGDKCIKQCSRTTPGDCTQLGANLCEGI